MKIILIIAIIGFFWFCHIFISYLDFTEPLVRKPYKIKPGRLYRTRSNDLLKAIRYDKERDVWTCSLSMDKKKFVEGNCLVECKTEDICWFLDSKWVPSYMPKL